MGNKVSIDILDDEVVRRFGLTSSVTLNELYSHIIKSYIDPIIEGVGFWGYGNPDPFEADERRRSNHNTIAAAWSIPRRLVSIALESVWDVDNSKRIDCFNLYVTANDKALVFKRFMDRLAEIRHEFYIDGKYWEFVDKVGNTWVEKSLKEVNDEKIELDGIPDMQNTSI